MRKGTHSEYLTKFRKLYLESICGERVLYIQLQTVFYLLRFMNIYIASFTMKWLERQQVYTQYYIAKGWSLRPRYVRKTSAGSLAASYQSVWTQMAPIIIGFLYPN